MATTIFDRNLRVLACENCGAPVQGTIVGGQTRCSYCGVMNFLSARDDARAYQEAHPQARMGEAQRISTLRAQDGRPLIPPPAVARLMPSDGRVADANLPVAERDWRSTCQEVAANPTVFAASERLFFLTMILYGSWSKQGDYGRARASLETALNYLTEPRYRATLYGMMTRTATRLHDHDAATYWLNLINSRSEDLPTDTAYRTSAAFLASAQQSYPQVVALLGERIDDIPIADSHERFCGVLRADALEKLGRLDEAVGQLTHWAAASGEAALQRVIADSAFLGVCQRSLPLALQAARDMEANVVRTSGGLHFGHFAGIMVGAAMLAPLGFGDFSVQMLVLIAVLGSLPMLASAAWILWTLRIDKQRRTHLLATGMRASARVISIRPTGISVNDVPQVELRLKVASSGQPAFIVAHREVMPPEASHRFVVGGTWVVVYDPEDHRELIVEPLG